MRHLLTTALTALPLLAHAWGAEGHHTVGTLAAGLIRGTPTEARVNGLLNGITLAQATVWGDCARGISPDHDFSYPQPGKYPECAPFETPEGIAEMADYVRRNLSQCAPAGGAEDCHKGYHYVNLAYQRSRYILGFTGTRPDDIVGATAAATRVLRGEAAPAPFGLKSPREALLVLAHLVGDLHQPLHVGSVYLDLDGRRVDPDKTGVSPAQFTRGGNQLLILAKPKAPPVGIGEFAAGFRPPNLHMVWDDIPAALGPKKVDAAWLKAARAVPGNPGDLPTWPARWAGGTLEQSGEAFRSLVFKPKQGSLWGVQLPADYNARMLTIKQRQLTLAGARLAQVLRTALP